MSTLRTTVTIDRLVLRGFEPYQRQALVEALQAELSRALSAPSALTGLTGSRRIPVMPLNTMPLEAGRFGSRKLGADLASRIAKGIQR